MTKPTSNNKLQGTLTDLQRALSEWDSIKTETLPPDTELDIRKKTQELVKQLNEQIKELGL